MVAVATTGIGPATSSAHRALMGKVAWAPALKYLYNKLKIMPEAPADKSFPAQQHREGYDC